MRRERLHEGSREQRPRFGPRPSSRRFLVRLRFGADVPAYRLRPATLADLDLLVRHRRGMWEEIASFTLPELEAADRAYRRWARPRIRSGSLVGFVIETAGGEPAASSCLWMMPTQPRPGRASTKAPYLMSMFTERRHRGKGLATRLIREARRWARAHGCGIILLHASRFGEPIYRREGFARTTEMRLRLDAPAPRPRRRKRGRTKRGR